MTALRSALSWPRHPPVRDFAAAVTTVTVKELRSRMRGRRAFVVLTVYLALLALLTYGVYVVVAPTARNMEVGGFGGANASALLGQAIFTLMSIFQLVLVAFIAPAFTAGQISLEREKQTLDLLITTPMRPGAIVIGKLVAALAFVVLMIVAAVPITAIVLMYGGASIDDIARQQIVLLTTALGLGAIGLFFSALLKRTQAATVLTYITMLALTLGTALLWIFWTLLLIQTNPLGPFANEQRAPEQLLYLNPGVAMLDVVANTEPGGGTGIAEMLRQLRGETGFNPMPGCIGPDCRAFDDPAIVPGPVDAGTSLTGHWWPRVTVTLTVLALVLTLLSMRFVVPTGMRWAFARRRVAPNDRVTPGGPAVEEAEA